MLRYDALERIAEDEAPPAPGADPHPPRMRDAVEEARRQLAAQTGREAS